MAFSIYTTLCNHLHSLVPEQFRHPEEALYPLSSHPPLSLPRPLATWISLLSLQICLFWTFHTICGLWVWLLSLSMMFPRFIHVVTRQHLVFFWRLRTTHACGPTAFCLSSISTPSLSNSCHQDWAPSTSPGQRSSGSPAISTLLNQFSALFLVGLWAHLTNLSHPPWKTFSL